MTDFLSNFALMGVISRFIPALLVLIVIYGILSYTKILGQNTFIHSLIALFIAILFLVSDKTSQIVSFMAPWFTVLFIFIIFILIAFKTMGISDGQIMAVIGEYKAIVWWVISIAVIIGLVALSNVFGQSFLAQQTSTNNEIGNNFNNNIGDDLVNQNSFSNSPNTNNIQSNNFNTNLTKTIFNPKILGFVLISLIASFSLYFMTKVN